MSSGPETHVATCFLRNRGEILLCRRSDEAGYYPGLWSAVADHIEGDPDAAAREEIHEELRLGGAVTLVRAGEPFAVEDGETHWTIHPYLFESDSRAVGPDHGTTEFEWASPTEIRRRETVPDLWKSYERVAPTVDTVKEDTDHGSAWLSVCALSVLRDRAGVLATDSDANDGDAWDDLTALAGGLRAARPGMTVVENRINRAMASASEKRPTAVERAAIESIERAFEADAAAAREAAALLDGAVLTLSRSGTVLDALRQTDETPVIVAESRPAREGVGVAEELAGDRPVTLAVDAAAAHVLAERPVGCVLVGADTVLPDGSVVNKVGTRGVAIAAAHEGIPVYAVAASDKISHDAETDFEEGDREAVYDGNNGIDVANPTFDLTPSNFVTVVTEDGRLDPAAVADHADELAALAAEAEESNPNPE